MSKETPRIKAKKNRKNKQLDTFTAICPECGKKHKKDLPSDGGYTGFVFECCETPDGEMIDELESVEITEKERKQKKRDWRVKGKKRRRHMFEAKL